MTQHLCSQSLKAGFPVAAADANAPGPKAWAENRISRMASVAMDAMVFRPANAQSVGSKVNEGSYSYSVLESWRNHVEELALPDLLSVSV